MDYIATGYYLLLEGGLYLIWDILQPALASALGFIDASNPLAIILVTTLGGFFVGMSIKWMRSPGEISAVVNNIHVKNGRMDYKQNRSMFVNSLISIVFGGSALPWCN